MKTGQIVIVTLHADPATPSGTGGGGGTHSYVRELMVGLAKNEWSVTVITRWADPELPKQEHLSSSTRLIRVEIGDVAPLDKRLLNDLHLASLQAVNDALGSGPEIHALHSVYWNSGRVAMDLSARLGLPFVHTVISNGWRRGQEGVSDQSPDRIDVERRVFRAAFAVLCVSEEERSDLVHHYDVNPNKAIVVGRPVAPNFQNPCHDEWGRPSAMTWVDMC